MGLRSSWLRAVALAAVMVLSAAPAGADTHHVPADAATIQAGINLAASGDTVLVAPGTYTGDGNRQMSFNGKAIVVMSEAGAEHTVIDCDGSSTNVVRAFRFEQQETPASVLQGFTIREGYGRYGGAIYCYHSSPTIRECVLVWNTAWEDGGAIACLSSAAPAIVRTTISDNQALATGGGLYCESSSPSLTHTILAFSQMGAAVECLYSTSTPTLACCDVYGNAGGDWVGCIETQADQNGNFRADPLFCSRPFADYRLESGSPCENATSCKLIGALEVGCVPNPHPRIWVVRPDGSGSAPTIQAAIDSARSSLDTVLVMPGTYTGPGNRDLDPRGKVLVIRSAEGPSATVIDCQGNPANPHRGFWFATGETPGTVVEGFTIRNGYHNSGAGVACVSASPTIRDCVIHRNEAAENGGGIVCRTRACPQIVSCTIVQNRAGYTAGGGFHSASGSAPQMDRCIVAFSVAASGVSCAGDGTVTLRCCDVFGNKAGDWTGCIQGQLGVDGNFEADPAFCDWFSGEFHLQAGSPCADAPGCGQVGPLGVACEPPVPRVWRVLPDGTGDAPTLQAAIDAATSGLDTVFVGAGVYSGEGNRDLFFHGKSLPLISECGPESTFIDCQGTSEAPHRAFFLEDGESPSTLVAGLTLRGGHADQGGAVWCRSSSPTFRDCVFQDNTATGNGGAFACVDDAAPVLESCVFYGNVAPGHAGGLYCYSSSPRVESCTFSSNAGHPGGAVSLRYGSFPLLENCILAFSPVGSGIFCVNSTPTLSCCDLYGNLGGDALCGADGGGNISAPPLFCDEGAGDVRLCDASPCLPENNDCAVLIGARNSGGCPCPQVRVLHVPGDYPTIGDGLAVAAFGDTVLVEPGTYVENVTLPWGVALTGRTGPDETTIDGGGDGTTVSIGFLKYGAPPGRAGMAVLAGFTITGGTASGVCVQNCSPHIHDCVVTGNSGTEGGGIYCLSSAAVLSACTIVSNTATQGGGLYCEDSPLTIENCPFTDNHGNSGGGLLCIGSPSPTITNSVFQGNHGDHSGGGVSCWSGSSPSLTDVIFSGNTAGERGGAVYCVSESSPTFLRCRFENNVADGVDLSYGGGLACARSNTALEECLLTGNEADYGGACWIDRCAVSFLRCTLHGNRAPFGGGVYLEPSSTARLEKTIVAFGAQGSAVSCESATGATLSCCDLYGNAFGDWTGCIAGQAGVNGNLSEDPIFCDAANGDLTLRAESPCAAENSPSGCGVIGALKVGCASTGVAEKPPVPEAFALFANVPNPFNPVTEIGYAIPAGPGSSRVELMIFNVLGQRVRTLVDADKDAGFYRATWDGSDDGGAPVASGVYFYRLTWNGRSETRRMVLLK